MNIIQRLFLVVSALAMVAGCGPTFIDLYNADAQVSADAMLATDTAPAPECADGVVDENACPSTGLVCTQNVRRCRLGHWTPCEPHTRAGCTEPTPAVDAGNNGSCVLTRLPGAAPCGNGSICVSAPTCSDGRSVELSLCTNGSLAVVIPCPAPAPDAATPPVDASTDSGTSPVDVVVAPDVVTPPADVATPDVVVVDSFTPPDVVTPANCTGIGGVTCASGNLCPSATCPGSANVQISTCLNGSLATVVVACPSPPTDSGTPPVDVVVVPDVQPVPDVVTPPADVVPPPQDCALEAFGGAMCPHRSACVSRVCPDVTHQEISLCTNGGLHVALACPAPPPDAATPPVDASTDSGTSPVDVVVTDTVTTTDAATDAMSDVATDVVTDAVVSADVVAPTDGASSADASQDASADSATPTDASTMDATVADVVVTDAVVDAGYPAGSVEYTMTPPPNDPTFANRTVTFREQYWSAVSCLNTGSTATEAITNATGPATSRCVTSSQIVPFSWGLVNVSSPYPTVSPTDQASCTIVSGFVLTMRSATDGTNLAPRGFCTVRVGTDCRLTPCP